MNQAFGKKKVLLWGHGVSQTYLVFYGCYFFVSFCFILFCFSVTLKLFDFDEEYVFGLPSAYARSILTTPWVELGDKLSLTCQKTNLSASIVFHTKVSKQKIIEQNFIHGLVHYIHSSIIQYKMNN